MSAPAPRGNAATLFADLVREADLRELDVLDRAPLPALDAIAAAAARLCRVEVAEVNVLTSTELVRLAASNGNRQRMPKDESFCAKVITPPVSPGLFILPDAREDPRFATSPYVTGERASIVFYAAAPLVSVNAHVLGTLCVFDSQLKEIDDLQSAALEQLGRAAMEVLEMQRRQHELGNALIAMRDGGRELIRSHASLESFAGQISHDLKGPLASITMALEMLDEDHGESAFLLQRALSGASRMNRTLTDLMSFALAGGNRTLARVDVDAVVANVLADLSASLLDARVSADPVPAVLGSDVEVHAVLQNLIANAVKFARPHGRPEVVVSGERRGSCVRVTVRDNGPGVPQASRARIFDLFGRATDEVEGAGIGLATCARIVQAQGGAIGVEEAPGGGALFWFELAAADPA